MNCDLINLSIGVSIVFAMVGIGWFLVKYPKEPFLSKTYFLLSDEWVWLYPVFFTGVAAPMIIASGFNKWFVFAAISLVLVTAFPNYKHKLITPFHQAFATLAGVFCAIGYIDVVDDPWTVLYYIVSYLAFNFMTYKKTSNPILWMEIFTFVMGLLMITQLFYCR